MTYVFLYPPSTIESAIASYVDRTNGAAPDETAEAYSDGFLAAIYGPRVAELVALREAGHSHAAWGRLAGDTENRWHAATADTQPVNAG